MTGSDLPSRAANAVGDERFRLLVDSVTDYAIFMLDPRGHIVSWNEGARRLKGYEAEEILGKHFSVFYPEEGRAQGHPAEELRVALERGRYEEEGWRVRKDGTQFWANVVLRPAMGPDGALLGFAKVTRDLTERRRAEQERQALIERLQRSNQELQDFAMVASHDLQEPLRKIQMFTERLREEVGPELGATARDYLDRMQRAATRGHTLIQGLLAFSRVTSKAQPAVPVDLGAVAAEVVQDLEGAIEAVRGRVDVGALPTVEADPLQMRQLLQNLIGNALKFHREGAPPIVGLSASRLPRPAGDAERWRLVVADNGIGFDEKYLDRVFKLFQRLHERGVFEGSGMGLAICRKIVERHGGRITARSTPGVGSRFLVDLPARQVERRAEP